MVRSDCKSKEAHRTAVGRRSFPTFNTPGRTEYSVSHRGLCCRLGRRLPTSLAQGSDADFVLVTLVVLGVATVAHFVGIRRRFTGVASFGASLIAVAIAGSFPATLVVGAPAIDYGSYVFVVAATVAAIAGLVMVVMSFRGSRLRTDTALRPIPH
jgi:hypothetical protein